MFGGLSLGVENNLKEVQREEDRYTSPSTKYHQKLEGKLKQDCFLPQITDIYQPEALIVIRAHGLKSNISNNKHNWDQIISLGIWQNCVLYCTVKCMAQYEHIHSSSMLCEINTKSFFSK